MRQKLDNCMAAEARSERVQGGFTQEQLAMQIEFPEANIPVCGSRIHENATEVLSRKAAATSYVCPLYSLCFLLASNTPLPLLTGGSPHCGCICPCLCLPLIPELMCIMLVLGTLLSRAQTLLQKCQRHRLPLRPLDCPIRLRLASTYLPCILPCYSRRR